MKKAIKWTTVVLLSPVALLVVLTALLYVTPIQQWVARQVAAAASDATGLDISVEHVDLSFPLDLGIDGILVLQPSTPPDTVARISRAVAHVELWPLLSGQVVLDELQLLGAQVNTLSLVGDLRLQGRIGQLRLLPSAHHTAEAVAGIDIDAERVALSEVLLSEADIRIFMSDTAAVDTTPSAPWRISFERITIDRSLLSLSIDSAAHFSPPATIVSAGIPHATIERGDIDLGQGRYAVGAVSLADAAFGMDSLFLFSNATAGLDSLVYDADGLRLRIAHGSMNEELTSLQLTKLQGVVSMTADSRLLIDTLQAATPSSRLSLSCSLPLAADTTSSPLPLSLLADADIGKADLQVLWPLLDPDLPRFDTFIPGAVFPLTLRAKASGSADNVNIERLSLLLPAAWRIEASGHASHFTNLSELIGQLDVRAETYTVLTPLLRLFGLPSGFAIPAGLSLTGTVGAADSRYSADLQLRHAGGTAKLKGFFHEPTATYEADAIMNQLQLRHFMPTDSFGMVTASVRLKGRGTDIYSSSTNIKAEAMVNHLQYGAWNLDSIEAHASIENSHTVATLTARNALANGSVDIEGTLRRNGIAATVNTQLNHVDLHALGIVDEKMSMGLNGTFSLTSDLAQNHHLEAVADHLQIHDASGGRSMDKMQLLLTTTNDSVGLRLNSGDLSLLANADSGYEQLLSTFMQIADSARAQFQSHTIDQLAIKRLLPTMTLRAESHQNNPVADLLRRHAGISFKNLDLNLNTSPLTGINGQIRLLSLNVDSTRIDTIRLSLVERENRGLTFNGQVTNNRRNPHMVFSLLFDGNLQEHGATIGLRYFDERNHMGIRIGTKAEMADGGLLFHIVPSRPTLGYKEFNVEGNNMIMLHNDMKMEADVDLVADDGTRLRIYSPEQQDTTLLQDLTISAHHIDLGQLTQSVALLPDVQGILEGDFHLMMDSLRNISVASDVAVEQMAYEGSPIGNIGSEFVYMNREDGSHAIDATLLLDDLPIGTLSGSFLTDATLDATLELERMPLTIVNGFIPDRIIGFEGFVNGLLTMKGKMENLKTNGQLALTDGYLVSDPYGMSMRFPTDTLTVSDSRINLNDFKLYAYNENPLTINGTIDFSQIDQMDINLNMRARNFQLINAKQKKESVAYGRMFVNCFARLTTSQAQMKLQGRLDVLGTTDLNYILLDSPLSTDNRMDELVRFTDFSDTTVVNVVQHPAPEGLDIDLTLRIDQDAHVRCALNTDQTNYVDLQGGGDLRLRMSNTDEMTLTGRYTVGNGTMKYSMPVIPLKTFNISEGSYVEFTGDPMNPRLSISATERTKAAVGQANEQSRMVVFDCGVDISQTLSDMGLQFTISAPEDMQTQSELNAMTAEQRGKLAVTMLTTGMYLADGNTSSFSMNSALSSFLQSEINNITSGALKTVNLQVGLDNSTDATGQTHTDYSFSFAKRFWNNRLNVQIGGKVSTGNEVEGQNQSFFNNVSMEYRLSATGNQYVKLFYNQNVYDWIDGYTGEYGGGYIWRRKLNSLLDIFRSAKPATPTRAFTRNGPSNPSSPSSPNNSTPNDSIATQ